MYIITVKLSKHPQHDPRNKKTGPCPYSINCTDVTGEHHSFIGDDNVLEAVRASGVHVTRVETM